MEDYLHCIMKPSLLLLSAISVHLSLSPPNPPVKQDELYWHTASKSTTLFEKFVQSITFCSKTMVWIGVATEILAPAVSTWKTRAAAAAQAYYYYYHSSSSPSGTISSSDLAKAHPFLNAGSGGPPATNIAPNPSDSLYFGCHPLLIAGVILTILAASLRIWCFKKLGPMFTFEITIRPKHELVTSGPYAWVRHPSYTGVYLTLIGASLVLCAPTSHASWLTSAGGRVGADADAVSVSVSPSLPGCIFAVLWVTKCLFAFRGTYLRLTTEDQVLCETFGREWELYAARVPSRLVPGVF